MTHTDVRLHVVIRVRYAAVVPDPEQLTIFSRRSLRAARTSGPRPRYAPGSICPAPYHEVASENVVWLRVEDERRRGRGEDDVRLRLERHGDDWQCTGAYLAGAGPLTEAGLRRLPLERLAQEAAARLGAQVASPAPPVTRQPRRGRSGQDPEFLDEIAALYRHACAQPRQSRRPVAWMWEQWPAESRPKLNTLHAWVVQARRASVLGPAMAGRSGEAAPRAVQQREPKSVRSHRRTEGSQAT